MPTLQIAYYIPPHEFETEWEDILITEDGEHLILEDLPTPVYQEVYGRVTVYVS